MVLALSTEGLNLEAVKFPRYTPKPTNKSHSFCTGPFLQEIQVALPAPNIYSVLNIPLFVGGTPENISTVAC